MVALSIDEPQMEVGCCPLYILKIVVLTYQIYILSYMCIIFVLHNWLYVMYHLPPKMETSLLQTQPPLANCNSLKVRFKIYLYVSSKQKGRLVQVSCSLCSETMERDILDIHKGENCPQRIVTCQFCEFPLPAIDLAEHQEVCGNRTELCHLCNKYVRLRERFSHEARCNGIQDSSVGTSRNVREAEREQGARRRPPPPQNDFSTKRLLFTIAITGIAVILGSFFLQRKADPSDVH
ncbi:XIAP-associated factor 1 isoform C [Glycine soja]|uniref:XIAP-associated factor 1 isoform B n=1 Tax=Glycine soja TaxID=3848 RepID=A0A445H7I0_GLYSO|nr:XIAP-associated factor 1 isoform B [Glycine soja]RZB69649.1 XIAP-associated factor 1 isoform C [Glycine soja]